MKKPIECIILIWCVTLLLPHKMFADDLTNRRSRNKNVLEGEEIREIDRRRERELHRRRMRTHDEDGDDDDDDDERPIRKERPSDAEHRAERERITSARREEHERMRRGRHGHERNHREHESEMLERHEREMLERHKEHEKIMMEGMKRVDKGGRPRDSEQNPEFFMMERRKLMEERRKMLERRDEL